MHKITYEDFYEAMMCDVAKNQTCIEMEFCIDNCSTYKVCWLGKTVDKNTKKDMYWFGLTEDGSQAYDFESFEEFESAKVFYKQSIKEIWNAVSLISIDACDVIERLLFLKGT